MPKPNETIGQRIKRLRSDRGWTQERLARESGVGQRVISELERDLHPNTYRATYEKIAAALAVSYEALVVTAHSAARDHWREMTEFAESHGFSPDDVKRLLVAVSDMQTGSPRRRRLKAATGATA